MNLEDPTCWPVVPQPDAQGAPHFSETVPGGSLPLPKPTLLQQNCSPSAWAVVPMDPDHGLTSTQNGAWHSVGIQTINR